MSLTTKTFLVIGFPFRLALGLIGTLVIGCLAFVFRVFSPRTSTGAGGILADMWKWVFVGTDEGGRIGDVD